MHSETGYLKTAAAFLLTKLRLCQIANIERFAVYRSGVQASDITCRAGLRGRGPWAIFLRGAPVFHEGENLRHFTSGGEHFSYFSGFYQFGVL